MFKGFVYKYQRTVPEVRQVHYADEYGAMLIPKRDDVS